mmetsp:Transcript_28871/g.35116  ORF Transcript_28871/g.35116 Transcript_28871/m.35116 type:complete len:161 (-) Transcript_28871:122-604(-)
MIYLRSVITFLLIISSVRFTNGTCENDILNLATDGNYAVFGIAFAEAFMECLEDIPNKKECTPDFTPAAEACEKIDKADYFTYDQAITCGSGTAIGVKGVPGCLPSSCTSDESALTDILSQNTLDGNCKSTFTFNDLSAGVIPGIIPSIIILLAGIVWLL